MVLMRGVYSFLILAFLLCSIAAQGQQLTVRGNSMQPTLLHGARVRLDTQAYQHRAPQRLDLVAVTVGKHKPLMVKRLMAVEHDRVNIRDGALWVNEQKVSTIINMNKAIVLQTQLARYDNKLPANTMIVLGDNQAASYDSRQLGLISQSQLQGKIVAYKTLDETGVSSQSMSLLTKRNSKDRANRNLSSNNYILSDVKTIMRHQAILAE